MTATTTELPPADLACPRCAYNLHGLTDPRCPECGVAFDWDELRDHGRDHHRWLFEHGRGRSARTFRATWLRTAAPGRFWQNVSTANPVHIRRLLLYWLVGCLPLLALAAVPLVADGVHMDRDLRGFRALYRPVPGRPGLYAVPGRNTVMTTSQINAVLPPLLSVGFVRRVFIFHLWHDDGPWLGPAAVIVAWPALSAGALLILRPSLRRRVPQLLRVAVYGCDFGLLMTMVTLVAATLRWPMFNLFRTSPITDRAAETIYLAMLACAAVAAWRMSVGCARYLRIDRPVASVLAAQAMSMLTVCAVLVGTARWLL